MHFFIVAVDKNDSNLECKIPNLFKVKPVTTLGIQN
jgi:hypothetical protein